MRRLRPAFVITSCLVTSCATTDATRPDAGLIANPPEIFYKKRAGKLTVAEASQSADAPTGPTVSLHPKDAEGRTVYVRDDNSCYVEKPKEGEPPPRAMDWTDKVLIACPPIFDDPAWDERRSNWELMMDEKSKSCFFSAVRGNPPPADIRATCPGATTDEPAK